MQFFIDVILFLVDSAILILILAWSWRFWMLYVNQKYLDKAGDDTIMLDIRLPREINKSPMAMEPIVASLLQGGGVGTWHHRNWQGNLPAVCGLEIASIEGVIHFYIRIHKKFKDLVSANVYAQYPGIEIVQADDYTKLIRYTHQSKDVLLWGASYKLSKSWKPTDEKTGDSFKKKGSDFEMSADFLPIKTYVDFGLDKDPKEEFKIDPIVPLLEFMGSVGKGEHVWYQILLQDEAGTFNDKKFPKTFYNEVSGKRFNLVEMAKIRLKQIRTGKIIKEGEIAYDEYGEEKTKKVPTGEKDDKGNPIMKDEVIKYKKLKIETKSEQALTVEEKAEIELINRKISKPTARVILRLIYLAKKENFNGGHVQNILSIMKNFAGVNSFGFIPTAPYDFAWQNFRGRRNPWRGEELFEEYVEREGFYPHTNSIEWLEKMEDDFFWEYPMKTRKSFRMLYEVITNPFSHSSPDRISVLNTEEIATLYHFPGQVASVPAIPRIDSTKSMAPSNLPQ